MEEKGQKRRKVKKGKRPKKEKRQKKEEGHSYLTQVKMTLFFIFLSQLRLCVLCVGVCSKYFFHFLFLNGLENPRHVPLYVWFLIMLS